jgi:Na+-translocating ferredoxin:NAD+ oxidoreductase RnfD subunit
VVIRQSFKARTPEELIALLGAVATAILAAIIVMVLYFGREIIIPIALAILLSFVFGAFSCTAPERAYSAGLGRCERCRYRLRIYICDG